MEAKEIRDTFVTTFGIETYRKFVLSLYESFPPRNRFFFWQEEQIKTLCNHLEIPELTWEQVYRTFDHCPLHNSLLIEDIVPIVDGLHDPIPGFYQTEALYFPLSNIEAPRNLEMSDYPPTVTVRYCERCRELAREWLSESKKKVDPIG